MATQKTPSHATGAAHAVSAALLAFVLCGAGIAQEGAININDHGLSGNWSNPQVVGQGLVLEFSSGEAQVEVNGGWYTFDTVPGLNNDKQRWYALRGLAKAGSNEVALELRASLEGSFDNPPQPVSYSVGQARLRFSSCTRGQLEFSFDDGRNGIIPLTRTHANVSCADGSRSGSKVMPKPQFGLSGHWARTDVPGQGLAVEINPVAGKAHLGWFTFAANGSGLGFGGQRWFVAHGDYHTGSTATTLTLYHTVYGTFNSMDSIPTIYAIGTVTLNYVDCDNLVVSYSIEQGEFAGRSAVDWMHRTTPRPAECAVTE